MQTDGRTAECTDVRGDAITPAQQGTLLQLLQSWINKQTCCTVLAQHWPSVVLALPQVL